MAVPEYIIETIPQKPGSYLLWLCLAQPQDLAVGKLGRFSFPRGDYIYLGSAHGPGGLRARLGRHLSGDGQPHWHIDRLRAVAQVRGFGFLISEMHTHGAHIESESPVGVQECVWSQMLGALPESTFPAHGFGASDCRAGCTAHLVHFSVKILPIIENFARQTGICLHII